MKAVILAGGLGTRLSEETAVKPKPMVEIGGMPILWHIMKIYSHYGINDFVICCGYKGYVIKEYFANYAMHNSNVTFDFRSDAVEIHSSQAEPWKVTLVDTGHATMTGGRVRRVAPFIGNEDFCLTYGDGVANVDIKRLIDVHKNGANVLATVTAVKPPGRFGSLEIGSEGKVTKFSEKPAGDGMRINGGFFVCSPEVLNYVKDDNAVWEEFPLTTLASEGKLQAFFHDGFWQPMDTLREKTLLQDLWESNKAPWKLWK